MPYNVPNLSGKSEAECQRAVQDALQAGHDRMCRMEAKQVEMKKSMDENTSMTAEAVGILNAMKGGMKVLNWLGIGLKWGAMVAGSIYTFYCIVKGKNPLI